LFEKNITGYKDKVVNQVPDGKKEMEGLYTNNIAKIQ
jgi:hypothetical protein